MFDYTPSGCNRRNFGCDGLSAEALVIPKLYSQNIIVRRYVGARRERECRECENEHARGPNHLSRRPRAYWLTPLAFPAIFR